MTPDQATVLASAAFTAGAFGFVAGVAFAGAIFWLETRNWPRIRAAKTGVSIMIQRQINHDPGTFPCCAACGREPRHISARGSHSREAFDVRRPTGDRHRLECRCGIATTWCDTLAHARNLWQSHFAIASRTATVRPLRPIKKESI
jgi:hypothetical protein